MKLPRKIPLRVVIGLLAAVIIDTTLQLFWKTAVLALPGDTRSWLSFLAIFREPLFIGVICVMSLQFFNWMAVLNRADLSFAQPVTALSYVSVGLLSAIFLNEPVDAVQILGIACVLAGVWFISRTDHATRSGSGEAA
jgi:drug/metabolite transporter (DMT)-like permease